MTRRNRREVVFERLLRRLAMEQWRAGGNLPPTRRLEREFRCSHETMLGALGLAAEHEVLDVRPRRPVVVREGAPDRARSLLERLTARGELRRLAVLLPETYWPPAQSTFFRNLVPAVTDQARRRGIEVEIIEWSLPRQLALAEGLQERGFGAAFALGFRAEHLTSLHALREQRFPVVVFNITVPGLTVPSVNMDEYGAAQDIAATMASRGHRNLCMISQAFDMRLKGEQHRVWGWLDYLSANGLLETSIIPVCYITPREDVMKYFGRIFGIPNRPTAVVFAYGILYEWFAGEPSHAYVRIPERLSVATFDPVGEVVSRTGWPAVTTITLDMHRAAQCAMEMIEEVLAGKPNVRSIRVPMRMNLTESIGPPPENGPRDASPDGLEHPLGGAPPHST